VIEPQKATSVPAAKRPRELSTIGFPYNDLDTAVTIAQAMIDAGGMALPRRQLAGIMGLPVGGSKFVVKLASARMFGLVARTRGKYELTNLGLQVVGSDENARRTARAKAFLTVPLYKLVYDEFRGKKLPPRPIEMEQAFVRLGVAAKQRALARIAFDKAARQAGFSTEGSIGSSRQLSRSGSPPEIATVHQVLRRRPHQPAARDAFHEKFKTMRVVSIHSYRACSTRSLNQIPTGLSKAAPNGFGRQRTSLS
jgi:hypothetical protein